MAVQTTQFLQIKKHDTEFKEAVRHHLQDEQYLIQSFGMSNEFSNFKYSPFSLFPMLLSHSFSLKCLANSQYSCSLSSDLSIMKFSLAPHYSPQLCIKNWLPSTCFLISVEGSLSWNINWYHSTEAAWLAEIFHHFCF